MKSLTCVSLLVVLVFAGCTTASYVAPDKSEVTVEAYSRVVDKPFDQAWSALMQFAGSAYFDIQQFEKQSGLLVLSFVGSTPGEYITGGQLSLRGVVHFDGDFVDYCVSRYNGTLEDRVNVIVAPVDSGRTRVTVRAHYVFTCGNANMGPDSWTFDSGTSDTHETLIYSGIGPLTRTLKPTYKFETSVLDAVEKRVAPQR